MKDKLEPNMYVKTKDGYIDKILLVDYAEEKRQKYPNHPSKKYWRDKILLLKAGYWRTTQNIIKASHNIIDIVQVGDYVNGLKVTLINEPSMANCYKRIVYAEDRKGYLIETFTENEIKSIVTKEQFESIKYSLDG